jgi:FAD/FMN-containing dehydrogenase
VAETFDAFEARAGSTYAVAWIDALALNERFGRGVLWFGEHASRADLARERLPPRRRSVRIPVDLPRGTLNRATGAVINHLYVAGARPGFALASLEHFFYPLDAITDWNRIYGREGFVQYQLVLPDDVARSGVTAILERVAGGDAPTFLVVLKRFGPGRGMLSFPTKGYSLAMDFAANERTFALLAELDATVAELGGRIYLAKDAPSRRDNALRNYPGLEDFKAIRRAVDPAGRFSSLLSRRLGL